jgi:hypothetical protein
VGRVSRAVRVITCDESAGGLSSLDAARDDPELVPLDVARGDAEPAEGSKGRSAGLQACNGPRRGALKGCATVIFSKVLGLPCWRRVESCECGSNI